MTQRTLWVTLLMIGWVVGLPLPSLAQRGTLEIEVIDQATGTPIPARMHLRDARGRPVKPPRTVYWDDHFVFDGQITLSLKPGAYTFDLEHGLEYKVRQGNFMMKPGAKDKAVLELERYVDMKTEGWWSGDLHVHRSPEQIELLMRAEDLHVAPVITWWNKSSLWRDQDLPENPLVPFDEQRFYHLMAGEDERGGGALLYFNLDQPLPIADAAREFPSPSEYLEIAAEEERVHVDIEKPFWWDMPVWVASGQVHSIGIANNHQQRSGMLENEAWGKPRDKGRLPPPLGNGKWTEEIYYKLLNCGIRIPPSAGSASGVLKNPVGYNRVYVHCDGPLDWDKWWSGLRAGRVSVTNGPLLRPLVNKQLPGHIFTAAEGETVELEIELILSIRDQVENLEVVKNGQVVHAVKLAEYAKSGGKLPKVTFQKSGWLLVRAITTNSKTYRFGSTGPYYVEIGQTPRISREASQFFLEWVYERARKLNLSDKAQRDQVLTYHRQARDFWKKKVAAANAD